MWLVSGARFKLSSSSDLKACASHPPGGVILPGLIDYGHPEFNGFAACEPPQLFANRYLWRGSPLNQALVRDTQDRLLCTPVWPPSSRPAACGCRPRCWSPPPSYAPRR